MKSILKQIIATNKEVEKAEKLAAQTEISNPATKDSRRNFLRKSAVGGIALGSFMSMSIEDSVAQATSKVNRDFQFRRFGSTIYF